MVLGLPPSLGLTDTDVRLERLATLLTAAAGRPITTVLARSYEDLTRRMQTAAVDAVWAPPFVAARLEILGFRVLLRGVRDGASMYRSALVAATAGLTLEALKGTRAVWVDRESVSGYLLPVAFLKSKGFNPGKDFVSQDFAGSFVSAVERVIAGRADFTAVFAAPASHPGSGATGLDEVARHLAPKVKVVAYTEDIPHSGLVCSARAPEKDTADLQKAVAALSGRADASWILKQVFGMDAFEPAPKLGYKALYKFAVASM